MASPVAVATDRTGDRAEPVLDPPVSDPDEPATRIAASVRAEGLATLAVRSLIAEADLTPKPGLVDQRGPGAHTDINLDLMHRSARSLRPCFRAMAEAAAGMTPCPSLRERLGEIGRDGERAMFAATGGANTHKGAIWALGLLVAGAAMCPYPADAGMIASRAGAVARYPDPQTPRSITHGLRARHRYGVAGARGEAQDGFPHVVDVGLPALRRARAGLGPENCARLDTLLAIMAELNDTCLLHRGGLPMLQAAQRGARRVLRNAGTSTAAGMAELMRLDAGLLAINASPGGSGDLFAATMFLDSLANAGEWQS